MSGWKIKRATIDADGGGMEIEVEDLPSHQVSYLSADLWVKAIGATWILNNFANALDDVTRYGDKARKKEQGDGEA